MMRLGKMGALVLPFPVEVGTKLEVVRGMMPPPVEAPTTLAPPVPAEEVGMLAVPLEMLDSGLIFPELALLCVARFGPSKFPPEGKLLIPVLLATLKPVKEPPPPPPPMPLLGLLSPMPPPR
jgi:hypothetical protein